MANLSLSDLRFEGSTFLENFVQILLEGPDAGAYLHRQTTNSFPGKQGQFILNSLLDSKGHVESYFFQYQQNQNTIVLMVPPELKDKTLERIERFHISEDFQIQSKHVTVEWTVGEKKLYPLRLSPEDVGSFKFGLCYNIPGAMRICSEFHPDGPSPNLKDLKQLSGFYPAISPGPFLFDTPLIDWVYDAKKGCFPGQETIAKIMGRRGPARRSFYLTHSEEIQEPVEGVEILKTLPDKGQFLSLVKVPRELAVDQSPWRVYPSQATSPMIDDPQTQNPMGIDEKILGTFQSIPYFSISTENRARDLFFYATKLFQTPDGEERAREFLEIALNLDPYFADAYESLGVLYGRHQNYQAGIEMMKKLLEVDPDSSMAHTNLSLFYMKIGNIPVAEEHKALATLKEFEKKGKEIQQKRQRDEVAQKERQEKRKMFLQVLQLDPADALANFSLGSLSFQEGDWEKAIEHFDQALQTDPNYSAVYPLYGEALLSLEQKDEAMALFQEGIKVCTKKGDLMPANKMQELLNRLG